MQDEGAGNSTFSPSVSSSDPGEKSASEYEEPSSNQGPPDADHAGEPPALPPEKPLHHAPPMLQLQARDSAPVSSQSLLRTPRGSQSPRGSPRGSRSPQMFPSGMCQEVLESDTNGSSWESTCLSVSVPSAYPDGDCGRCSGAPSAYPRSTGSGKASASSARHWALTNECAEHLSSTIADAVSKRLVREIRTLLSVHGGHPTSHAAHQEFLASHEFEGGSAYHNDRENYHNDRAHFEPSPSFNDAKKIYDVIGEMSIKGHLLRRSFTPKILKGKPEAERSQGSTSSRCPGPGNPYMPYSSQKLESDHSEHALEGTPERKATRSNSAPPRASMEFDDLLSMQSSMPWCEITPPRHTPPPEDDRLHGKRSRSSKISRGSSFDRLHGKRSRSSKISRGSRTSKISKVSAKEDGVAGRTNVAVRDVESAIGGLLIAGALPSTTRSSRVDSVKHGSFSKRPSLQSAVLRTSTYSDSSRTLFNIVQSTRSAQVVASSTLTIPVDNRSVASGVSSNYSNFQMSDRGGKRGWRSTVTSVKAALGKGMSMCSDSMVFNLRSTSPSRGSQKSGVFGFKKEEHRQSGLNEIRESTINGILASTKASSDDNIEPSVDFDELVEESAKMKPRFLQVFGIYPWYLPHQQSRASFCMNPSTWYQWIALLLALLAAVGCFEQIITTRSQGLVGTMCYKRACLRLGLVSDVSLSLGGIFGMLALSTHLQSYLFVECRSLLLAYAAHHEFGDRLSRAMRWDLATSLTVMALAVIERIRTCRVLHAAMDSTLDWWGILQTLAFFFYSSILLGLTFAVLQFCRTMMIMIDTYCYDIASKPNLDGAVCEWNVLQAILRKASTTVERCFFVLQTTALCFVFAGVTDVVLLRRNEPYAGDGGEFSKIIQTLIPGLLVTAGVARIFFHAAAVTDKCAHVPSLINSITYRGIPEIDHIRQYVVEYIIHSAAGFYVFEVRLTQALALKFMYFSVAAAFTVAATVMTDMA